MDDLGCIASTGVISSFPPWRPAVLMVCRSQGHGYSQTLQHLSRQNSYKGAPSFGSHYETEGEGKDALRTVKLTRTELGCEVLGASTAFWALWDMVTPVPKATASPEMPLTAQSSMDIVVCSTVALWIQTAAPRWVRNVMDLLSKQYEMPMPLGKKAFPIYFTTRKG